MNQLKLHSFIDDDGADKFIVTEVLVDNSPITDFKKAGLTTNMVVLEKSINQNGDFFIVTCWCGIAECAGIRYGIKVSHSTSNIHWVVRGFGDPQTYYFDQTQYKKAIKNGIRQLQYMMKDKSLRVVPSFNKSIVGNVFNTQQNMSSTKNIKRKKRKRKS